MEKVLKDFIIGEVGDEDDPADMEFEVMVGDETVKFPPPILPIPPAAPLEVEVDVVGITTFDPEP